MTSAPSELADDIRAHLDALAVSTDPEAFQQLLAISAYVGECLGTSARSLAEAQSWTSVAGYAGTTKQAAWSRWRH